MDIFSHQTMAQTAFLCELLATSHGKGEAHWAIAQTIAARWAQAVAGGDEKLFRRRLNWDGWPQGHELLARLARGWAAGEQDRGSELVQQLLPPGTSPAQAAERLAHWAARELRRRWPKDWWQNLSGDFRRACQRQLETLLRQAGGAGLPVDELLQRRPIVGRWLGQRAWEWVCQAQRLARRFARDRRALAAAFSWPRAYQRPAALLWGLSDRHRGEAVVALSFPDQPAVFYKPRSLQPEAVLSGWFELFRQLGVPSAPLPPMVVRSGYGWMLEVPRAHLRNRQQLARWFYSAGALAAVAWVLGLRDLHWENVIAAEEGPVVVDGECWAQPVNHQDLAGDNPLSSGLLTLPISVHGQWREDGALLGGGQARAKSLPLWQGQPAPVAPFVSDVLAGFSDSLERLARAAGQRGFAKACWQSMQGLRVRWLARPSEAYAQLLTFLLKSPKVREGWHANLLTEAVLRPMVATSVRRPALWPQAREEQRSLLALSVPRLVVRAAQKTESWALSGRQAIWARLTSLTPSHIADLVQQVRAALPRAAGPGGEEVFQQQAREVASLLAASSPNGCPFLGSGAAGQALAWAAWARVSSEDRARRRALQLYQRVLDELPPRGPVGFCTGLGGVAYALAAGSALLQERQLAEQASALLGTLDRLETALWDVEGGLAGLILGSWALLEPFPQLRDQLLTWAEGLWQLLPLAGERDHGPERPEGFAHGYSGAAAALGLLGKVGHCPRLVRRAWQLFLAEPAGNGWVSRGRTATGVTVPLSVQGWCHGAPGALLARLAVGSAHAPEEVAREERLALEISLRLPLVGPASLCCGTIARSEILLIGAQLQGREVLWRQARERCKQLCRSGSWRSLPSSGGLFDGLPGFLFHLCRQLAPQQVGSALFGEVVWQAR